jgi:energy-coupling factor transporter ATP-binding protein EcfA2
MLKSLTIQNYRAFSKPVTVEFKPITVLIGRNSAGKSSLLRWLNMARQSVIVPPRDRFFVSSSPAGEYVDWNEQKNRNSSGQSHHFALELAADIGQRDLELLRRGGRRKPDDSGPAEVEEGIPSVNYKLSGRVIYRRQQEYGEHAITLMERDGFEFFHRKVKNLKGSSFLFPQTSSGGDYLEAMILDVAGLKPARDYMANIAHMGAVRREMRGVIDLRTPPSGDVGHDGEFTNQHLVEIFQSDDPSQRSSRDFILKHAEAVLGVEGIRVRKIGDGLTSRPEGRNAATNVTHRLNDFGFGVSQALPVFVQGAIIEKGGCFAVEQPEAQIHPTAQLEMGTFFRDLWKERGVNSIIETHSSNILLRLRRHVRAGELSPDDVSVAYFKIEDGIHTVTNMGIRPDGELDGHLPMEFFGADLYEALEINALPVPKPE